MPSRARRLGVHHQHVGHAAPRRVIGVKSRIGSYGIFAYSQGLIACVATAPMTMVRAVGRRLGDRVGAEVAAGAGRFSTMTVPRLSFDPLGQRAGDDVERAAGRIGHDEAERPGLRDERTRAGPRQRRRRPGRRGRCRRFIMGWCSGPAQGSVLVGLGRERVGVELVVGQAAAGDEVALRRLDHDRRAAGIDLVARQVRQVVHHRLVDEAGAAGPVVLGLGLGEHRHVAQVRQSPRSPPRPSRACTGRRALRQPQYSTAVRWLPFSTACAR